MQDDSRLNLGLNKKQRSSPSEKGRPLLAFVIIVVLAGVVGWFWLIRDPESRERLNQTVDSVRSAVADPSGAVSSVVSSVVSGASALLDSTLSKSQGPTTPPPVGQINGSALPGAPSPLVQPAPADTPSVTGNATSPESILLPGMPSGQPGSESGTLPQAAPLGSLSANATTPQVAVNEGPSPAPSGAAMSVEELLRGKASNPEGPLGNGSTQRGAVLPLGAGTPRDAGRSEDMVVRPAFIDDLAQWMVDNYQPSRSSKGKGVLQVSMQAANLRYGAGMRGLYWIGDNLPKGRSEALQYVFTPSMLDALYRLYIDRFMEAMAQAGDHPDGRGKPLSPEQRSDLYAQYAKRFQGIAGALGGIAAMPDLNARVDTLRKAAQDVVNANARYSDLVFQQDKARESGNTAEAQRLAGQTQTAAAVYKEAVIKRERLRDAFAKSVGSNKAARLLDDETLVYVGMWIDRRVRDNRSKLDAASQASTIFDDLAKRFQQAAGADS